MVKYILKRVLIAIFIIFGVTFITYALFRTMPDNYVYNKFMATAQQNPHWEEQADKVMELYGLKTNIIAGYFSWLGNALCGDFGTSFIDGMDVVDKIRQSIPVSFVMSLIVTILQLVIAIPLGIRAAVNQYGAVDYATTVFTLLGISLPSFFFAGLAIKLFAVDLGWFDASLGLLSAGFNGNGWEMFWDKAWHLILPIFVMTILSLGGLMRYTRTNMLEVLNADYIRTAKAKGVKRRNIIYKHAFKNTAIPLVTMLAGILPGLFSGSFVIEQLFGIQGIGFVSYNATVAGDIPFAMAYNLFITVFTVLGILLADIMYALVDPRVKLGK